MTCALMSHAPLSIRARFAIAKRSRKQFEQRNRESVVAALRSAGPRTWRELIDGTGLPPDELGKACDTLRVRQVVVFDEDLKVYRLSKG